MYIPLLNLLLVLLPLVAGNADKQLADALTAANAFLSKSELMRRNAAALAADSKNQTSAPASHPVGRPAPHSAPTPPTLTETLQKIREQLIFDGVFRAEILPRELLDLPGGGLVVSGTLVVHPHPLSSYYYDSEHDYLQVLESWVKQQAAALRRAEQRQKIDITVPLAEVLQARDEQIRKLEARVAPRKEYYESIPIQVRVLNGQAAAVRSTAKPGQTWTAQVQVDDFELMPSFQDAAPASAPAVSSGTSAPGSQPATQPAPIAVNSLPPTIGRLRVTLAAAD